MREAPYLYSDRHMAIVPPVRVVFMGTAGFAVPSLKRLVHNGYVPVAAVTGPDRKRGRGQELSYTPVKEAALESGIEHILQPENVKDPAFAEEIRALRPDIIVVVAYRILPPAVFNAASLGAFNLHGSLLPKYRGAAPINRAVMAGDEETGVTTFFLAEKVDTGTMILQRRIKVGPNETAGDVHDRLMEAGADLVLDTVRLIEKGPVSTFTQDEGLVSKAPKIFRDDCHIDWQADASVVHDHIRGLSPYPGAWTTHGSGTLKIYESRPVFGTGSPGTVLQAEDRLVIACGTGGIEVREIQQEGRKRMAGPAFLRGYSIQTGDKFS